ncbi:MAG: cytidine deaminase [Acidobacteriota bacterium]
MISTLPDLAPLFAEARRHQNKLALAGGGQAGGVAAALITDQGNVYSGISIVVPCGMGFCAEHAAIAEMLKHGERNIAAIVALDEELILPPCGRCRELIVNLSTYNQDTLAAVSETETMRLAELLPNQWNEYVD